MPRKIRELRADLRRAGFVVKRTTSSHTVWVHPLLPGHVSVSGSDGSDAKPYQEKDIQDALRNVRDAERRLKS